MVAALLVVSACRRAGELTVMIDSTWSREELEVVLVPVDPEYAGRFDEFRPRAARADSLRATRDQCDSHHVRGDPAHCAREEGGLFSLQRPEALSR
jgi:hypothetical protein